MNAPWQAMAALAWALAGPPLLLYAAVQVRRGRIPLHGALMGGAALVTIGIVLSFGFVGDPSPRRPALQAQPVFKLHLTLALLTLGGIAWQLLSRVVARLRRIHRRTGPIVVACWCLALLTGIYNYVFLYCLKP